MKDSASAQNTIVAFYWEYSRYRYLYFITGKQWNKVEYQGVSTNQYTSIARVGVICNDRNHV